MVSLIVLVHPLKNVAILEFAKISYLVYHIRMITNLVKRNNKGQFIKGQKFPKYFSELSSIKRKGHKISEETRKKISEGHKVDKVDIKCQICGIIKNVLPCFSKKRFCSRECFYKSRKGIKRLPFTEEHRKNIGNAQRGKKRFPRPEWLKEKLSKERMGENNPNWKGGNSREKHNSRIYKKWTKNIFERDDYTCKECNQHGGYLEAHHVKSWIDYPKERYNLDNGITLCKKCHKLIHKKLRLLKTYGKGSRPDKIDDI